MYYYHEGMSMNGITWECFIIQIGGLNTERSIIGWRIGVLDTWCHYHGGG